jgi:hypothetical protein
MLRNIDPSKTDIEPFDEDDMPVRVRLIYIFEILVKFDPEFIIERVNELINREKDEDDWRECYTDCLLLLSVCRIRDPAAFDLMRRTLKWVVESRNFQQI